jgi:hypothetical protein
MSAILDGKDNDILASNRIDNPIAALTNPIEVVQAIDLCDTEGARADAECLEPFCKKSTKRFGECAELLFSRRSYKNRGDRLGQSAP